MTDGIYICDVLDYRFLLTPGKPRSSFEDWFYWWLADNGVERANVESLVYNELQGTIYTTEIDWGQFVPAGWHGRRQKNRRRGFRVVRAYEVVEPPPTVLLDRWDWLMEEIRGNERALCASG